MELSRNEEAFNRVLASHPQLMGQDALCLAGIEVKASGLE